MAYFDNAATTYPKPECVYSYMDSFYRNSGASVGRGQYALAQTAGQLIADTRSQITTLLHCPLKQVVFTPTATFAINLILQGIISQEIENVYISPFEHNAVTRTLHHYEKMGKIRVHQLHVTKDMQYDLMRIGYQFDGIKPDLVIVSHASNVFGVVAPAEDIFTVAKRYKAITVLDMAQTAGLIDCNIGSSVFDFAVFAGHKTLYGPTGISGFVMNPEIPLTPVIFGGTGFESANQDMPNSLPERFEMGTINSSGLAGLHASLSWIQEQSIDTIRSTEMSNRNKLVNILNDYDFIRIVGNYPNAQYVGVVSCLINGISSDSAGNIFDRCGISVRTGLHCAPLAHQFMGTFPAGTIRFSVSYFTNDDDFNQLRKALDYIDDNM